MTMPEQSIQFAIQFGGSLLAIFALAWLVHRLRLGGDKRIRSESHAQELADEVMADFSATEITVDTNGRSALLRDPDGRIMVLKMHGSKPAGRVLGAAATARFYNERGYKAVDVQTGEHWFGNVWVHCDEAADWVRSIEQSQGVACA